MKRILVPITILILFIISIIYFITLDKSLKENTVILNHDILDEEDYIIGVIACEMPASFESDALKAQAIASRTYALYKKNLSLDDQCYINIDEMKSKWGSDFNKYYSLLKTIALSTKNLVMKKDNELFKSYYFSTSNGYTEDSKYVFGDSNITSVESSWDKFTKNYKYESTFSYDELSKILGDFTTIEILSRNSTNHVESIKVDNNTYTGIEFRKLLSLRSTDFEINKSGDDYIITTYGYGHGVGMSQTGANELAKLGYNYEYILKYYYGDIKIEEY